MAAESAQGVSRALRTLYSLGAVGGMSDAQLLERFNARRDQGAELAFEALVRRHGPMVLRVAMDVLGNVHDAHDAFQTTFVILARRAAAIARPEALGPWLYGVAQRVAMKAKVNSVRRRAREHRAADHRAKSFVAEGESREAWRAIHQEIARLPEKFRFPVVLCYLEGKTYDEAALQLRLTEGAIRGRLARAKALLRTRLSRRGLAPCAGLLIAALSSKATSAALPCGLLNLTVQAARRITVSRAAIPLLLVEVWEGAMAMTTWTTIGTIALAFGLLVTGVGGLAHQAAGDDREIVPVVTPRPPDPKGTNETRPVLELTLELAMERLVREDPDLRAKFADVPTALADLLTVDLRANSLDYSDGELVPYGRFTKTKPDGTKAFDVNVTYPHDALRRKWKNTGKARKVLEAQYQDAVRLKLDDLCKLYVDVLEAREIARECQGALQRSERLQEHVEDPAHKGTFTRADVARATIARDQLRVSLVDRKESLTRAKRALLEILRMSPEDAPRLELREAFRATAPLLLDSVALSNIALECRPDLVAARLGVTAAYANAGLSVNDDPPPSIRADLDQEPMEPKNLNSLDEPARKKLAQVRLASAVVARNVRRAVREAYSEFDVSLKATQAVTDRLLPSATEVRDDTRRLFTDDQTNVSAVLTCEREYNKLVHESIKLLARHRRSRYALNTAVGQRILP